MNVEEYLDAVNEFANDLYECGEVEALDGLEITVMSVATRYGVEIFLEDWDTG